VGAFSALTAKNDVTVQENGTLVRSTELAAPLTAFNILRLKREFGGSGHLGVIGTSSTDLESAGGYSPGSMLCPDGQFVQPNVRCFHDAFVGGADALVRSPSGNYVASGAFIQSLIHGGPPRTFVDGTTVNPGASAPGGWVRLAKEGGKHIIASAEYAGAGRDLDYNDVGYMQRQNFQELKGSFGYRTLEAGAHTIDTTTVFEASGRRNLSGVDLGQLYELSTRLHLRSFWTLAAAADFQPARFDDREIGNGAALERAGWAGWKVEVDTDPRGKLVAGFANQTQLIAGGAYAVAAQGTLALHALPQLDFELLPSVTWSGGEWRYGFNADTPGIFGRLAARSVSATLRASYTFTPQLSLQTYAQAFLASGHYSDLRAVAAPAGTLVHRAEIAAAPTMAAATPDFEEAALNVNVVLRWEYHLGSTLFLVYSRSQVPAVALTGQPASFDFRQLGNRASADVILFKISFWWST
jgi:hypothetical protein